VASWRDRPQALAVWDKATEVRAAEGGSPSFSHFTHIFILVALDLIIRTKRGSLVTDIGNIFIGNILERYKSILLSYLIISNNEIP
jgi:hypothetical protein